MTNGFNEDDFYRLITSMKQRPAMWIGKADIELLKAYLDGYRAALNHAGAYQQNTQTTLFPLIFWFMHEFAKIKTNSYESTSGWANLILSECKGDKAKALDRFFEYFDEFCALRAVGMQKAILTEENIFANDNMHYCHRVTAGTKAEPIYDSPQAVYFIELSDGNGFLCAVETAKNVQVTSRIFRKDELWGEDNFESPEKVFGQLTTLTDITCDDNPDFGKSVHFR